MSEKWTPEVVDRLAAIEHERWAGWMRYLFSQSDWTKDGVCVIPKGLAARWVRQMNTEYADLPEAERESDRAEVRKTLAAISSGEKP